ncbi:PhzF family phenazine biosynthesis protein [Halomonas sp. 18H]|uniref:PhzF family phenazine biosynthesis protein n=1 Tax=Halomonas almeriensis TaxID=308163 RepID=UPI00222F9217|nr:MULTISPECIES: PhzF family phenazine biosynthesis protein [Halomonas]MCW4152019.1 PhzF family phenazine biosynthesis protein [Halomonas sp. 18H]MDN3552455.1 PhzF family phenazine biosynthesis protein [Halomonas almeriensis]
MTASLLRYYLLDVFTATPLAGNPLAVFLDSEASLSKVMPDIGQWVQHISPSGVEQVYLYVANGDSLATRTFIRAFAGFKKDPATGSAAAALVRLSGHPDAPQRR